MVVIKASKWSPLSEYWDPAARPAVSAGATNNSPSANCIDTPMPRGSPTSRRALPRGQHADGPALVASVFPRCERSIFSCDAETGGLSRVVRAVAFSESERRDCPAGQCSWHKQSNEGFTAVCPHVLPIGDSTDWIGLSRAASVRSEGQSTHR